MIRRSNPAEADREDGKCWKPSEWKPDEMHLWARGGKVFQYRRALIRVKDNGLFWALKSVFYAEFGWNHGAVVPSDDGAFFMNTIQFMGHAESILLK